MGSDGLVQRLECAGGHAVRAGQRPLWRRVRRPDRGHVLLQVPQGGDWDIAIGSDFSNYGYDITWTTAADNEPLYFLLDLPNGRWNVIPEPASLLGLALLGLFIRRR